MRRRRRRVVVPLLRMRLLLRVAVTVGRSMGVHLGRERGCLLAVVSSVLLLLRVAASVGRHRRSIGAVGISRPARVALALRVRRPSFHAAAAVLRRARREE